LMSAAGWSEEGSAGGGDVTVLAAAPGASDGGSGEGVFATRWQRQLKVWKEAQGAISTSQHLSFRQSKHLATPSSRLRNDFATAAAAAAAAAANCAESAALIDSCCASQGGKSDTGSGSGGGGGGRSSSSCSSQLAADGCSRLGLGAAQPVAATGTSSGGGSRDCRLNDEFASPADQRYQPVTVCQSCNAA
jgi:hypothetical protein